MFKFLFNLFDLHQGEDDKGKTLQNVKSNISFSGANLWILACAILVASVGLNVNSTAVIIGAMLISPLMGPIIAAGFALGIYDFQLLKRALKNLLIATIVSLTVSTVYFYLSPFKEVHSELLARTSPNIFDIFIAFFGGLVGVIAVTRVEKGNPIPGVAIATALMPPLCTAGYGLATGQYSYFFGAFFLYCINCVFICIATYAIVKFLKYPSKEQVNIKHQKQIKYSITLLITLMMLPGIYFAYTLYKQQEYTQAINNFIEKELIENGSTIIYKKTNLRGNNKSLELAFLSQRFSQYQIDSLNSRLKDYGISDTKIIVRQDSLQNIQKLRKSILNEIQGANIVLEQNESKIKMLEAQIARNTYDNMQIFKEANAIFPSLQTLSIANHNFFDDKNGKLIIPVLIYKTQKDLSKWDRVRFENWLKQRLVVDSVLILEK
ncbi:MAG TPA: TIGR00341 family protein [Bacteroidia bacterium]|nr:TIGR00341 family protein [Bacteroidia bacterium]